MVWLVHGGIYHTTLLFVRNAIPLYSHQTPFSLELGVWLARLTTIQVCIRATPHPQAHLGTMIYDV